MEKPAGSGFFRLVVFTPYLKIGLGVRAGRTGFRRFLAVVNMPAVPALPLYFLFFLKSSSLIELFEKSQVTLFMLPLHCSDRLKEIRYFNKTLIPGCSFKILVHRIPFVMFTSCCRFQIISCA